MVEILKPMPIQAEEAPVELLSLGTEMSETEPPRSEQEKDRHSSRKDREGPKKSGYRANHSTTRTIIPHSRRPTGVFLQTDVVTGDTI